MHYDSSAITTSMVIVICRGNSCNYMSIMFESSWSEKASSAIAKMSKLKFFEHSNMCSTYLKGEPTEMFAVAFCLADCGASRQVCWTFIVDQSRLLMEMLINQFAQECMILWKKHIFKIKLLCHLFICLYFNHNQTKALLWLHCVFRLLLLCNTDYLINC